MIEKLYSWLLPVARRTLGAPAALFTLLLVAAAPGVALGEESAPVWEEGVNYERLPIPVATSSPDKVEVVEVFSYACIHCMHFEPTVAAWEETLPSYVAFVRMPATFNASWATLAQGYYTAEALGVVDKVHEPMFEAIHNQRINLTDPKLMAELFEREAGVSEAQFNQVFNSFSVRSRVQQADARGRAYRITGTPTMVVDGTFRVDGRMAGSNADMMRVVDYLVEQQRALRGISADATVPAIDPPAAAAASGTEEAH
ncbi:MAG: thiol:disulfide interchange protein DsbA/DsbL [Pseudomonadales bacterium]